MSDFVIDFDEILVDDTFDIGEDDDELEFKPLKPLPTVVPVAPSMSAPYPMRSALELVANPNPLFDFSKTKLSPQQQMYIMQYAVKGTKMGACTGAGVPYLVATKWNDDPEFCSALAEAMAMAQDALEEELLRRAMNGSDKLMIEAIRASKPEKYARKESKDVNIHGTVVHTWSELASQAKTMLDAPEPEEAPVVDMNPPVVVDVDFEEVI